MRRYFLTLLVLLPACSRGASREGGPADSAHGSDPSPAKSAHVAPPWPAPSAEPKAPPGFELRTIHHETIHARLLVPNEGS